MIDQALLDLLVCPENHSRLRLADAELVARVNAAIAAGGVKNRGGQPVAVPVQGGLVREDGAVLYPIIEEIPVLLIDEALPLDQLTRPEQE